MRWQTHWKRLCECSTVLIRGESRVFGCCITQLRQSGHCKSDTVSLLRLTDSDQGDSHIDSAVVVPVEYLRSKNEQRTVKKSRIYWSMCVITYTYWCLTYLKIGSKRKFLADRKPSSFLSELHKSRRKFVIDSLFAVYITMIIRIQI